MVKLVAGASIMSELSRLTAIPGTTWQRNPVFFQLLGLSPILAVSTSVVLGFALGVITAFVMLLATNLNYWLRNYVEPKWHHSLYLVVLATLTTITEVFIQIYWYQLYRDLGVYLPLICCNSIVLIHLAQGNTNSALQNSIACTKVVLGFLSAIVTLSAIRELLGNGSLLTNWQLLIPASDEILPNETGGKLLDFALLQPGALLLLGLLIALYNWLNKYVLSPVEPEIVKPVKRARITGRI